MKTIYIEIMPQKCHLTGLLAIGLFFVLQAFAAPGDLDLSFGSGGIVVSPIAGSETVPGSILTQPDGKILVCGLFSDSDEEIESYFLARYHPNGTLDASFGTNGKIIGPSYSGVYTGSDIALQPDGKIITVGFSISSLPQGFAVQRYNANGTLDRSFGTGGFVITPVVSFSYAGSVLVQADGKIVVFGYGGPNNSDFIVARFDPNGSLDTSFNGTGIVITSFGSSSYALAAVLQPDGKIVAAGYAHTGPLPSPYYFALARYNTDGSLDPGFGEGGKVIHKFSPGHNHINDVALQPDGKIVATGEIYDGATSGSAIVRYNTNGSIDTSFAQNGIFTTDGNFYVGNSIALQSDGKLVAFGKASNPSGSAIARLNPNGTPDTSFGTDGRVITLNHRPVADGAVQSDGKILAVGGRLYGFPSIEIARYLGDPVHANGKIAFTSDRDGNREIYVMDPDGSNQVRLTKNKIIDDHPIWSPDGRKIAFLSQRDSGEFAIFVMNADGTAKTEITTVNYQFPSPWRGQDYWSMSWAPDGYQIVFQDIARNVKSLFVVNADGSGRRNLTTGFYPAWSPDGSKILFMKGGLPLVFGLYTIHPEGTGLQDITPHFVPFYRLWDESPAAWSPDSSKIAVNSFDFANHAINIVNADGSNPQFFVKECAGFAPDGCSVTLMPAWSPDGSIIAFTNFVGSGTEIYIKEVASGFPTRLTNTAGHNSNPNWQPATLDIDVTVLDQ